MTVIKVTSFVTMYLIVGISMSYPIIQVLIKPAAILLKISGIMKMLVSSADRPLAPVGLVSDKYQCGKSCLHYMGEL